VRGFWTTLDRHHRTAGRFTPGYAASNRAALTSDKVNLALFGCPLNSLFGCPLNSIGPDLWLRQHRCRCQDRSIHHLIGLTPGGERFSV
jgi:hypothetical protein